MTLALSAPAVQAVQAVAAAAKATGETKNGRMQALGAASTALAAAAAAAAVQEALAKAASGSVVNVSITVGQSKSKSKTETTRQSDSARGSSVSGNNVVIAATGAGQDSNVLVQGSDITAKTNTTLLADNRIDLLASQGSASQQTTSSSQSSAVGVAIDVGAGGVGFGVTASASAARGRQDGADVDYANTHIKAGDTATLLSGGDTTLSGAVVAANTVKADIGGNLAVQSLQDTSVFQSKNQSIGGSVTVGFGGSGSAYLSNAKAKGDFASVAEQSGIKAGDGGFDVKVKGATDLKGGVIASTQAALDSGKNSFRTASLTTSDIQNRVSHAASGVSVSGGYGKKDEAAGSASGVQTFKAGSNGAAVGVASDKGSQASTTKAGISGIAGDQGVRTGDTGTGLTKDWSGAAMSREVNAQLKITSTFGQQASKAVGDYATNKFNELKGSDPIEAAKWAEGGEYRVAAHAVIGGLSGGLQGALGAAASQAVIDQIGQKIADTDLPLGLKQTLVAAAGAVVGAATGGAAGAASGLNATVNNYLSVADLRDYRTELQNQQRSATDPTTKVALGAQILTVDKQIDSASNAIRVGFMATNGGNFDPSTMTNEEIVAMGFAFDAAGAAEIRAVKKVTTSINTLKDNAAVKVEQAKQQEQARIANNSSRDGGMADPSLPMSASGGWKPAAALTPAEANALVSGSLPSGVRITGTSSADAQNAQSVATNYSPPFVPGTQVLQTVTTQPTSFVRVYADAGGPSSQAGSWMMRADDVTGLTAQQIASKFGLPQVPTMITDVTVPKGTSMNVSVANGISPFASSSSYTGGNGGGGGVQFNPPNLTCHPLYA